MMLNSAVYLSQTLRLGAASSNRRSDCTQASISVPTVSNGWQSSGYERMRAAEPPGAAPRKVEAPRRRHASVLHPEEKEARRTTRPGCPPTSGRAIGETSHIFASCSAVGVARGSASTTASTIVQSGMSEMPHIAATLVTGLRIAAADPRVAK